MKKIRRLLHLILFMLLGGFGVTFVGLFSESNISQAVTPDSTVDVTLHKLADTDKTEVQNTGLVMEANKFYDENKDFKYLSDVTFEAFNISKWYYDLLEDKGTTSIVMDFLNGANLRVDDDGDLIYDEETTTGAKAPDAEKINNDDNTTDDNGQVVYSDLLRDFEEDRGNVYVFIETARPAEVATAADPLIIALPLYGDEDTEITDIHLYPKNQLNYGSLAATKYIQVFDKDAGGNITGVTSNTLAGAQFVIHQEGTTFGPTTKVLSTLNATGLRNWVDQTDEAKAAVFVTGQNGQLTIPNLAPGNYLLSEISTSIPIGEGKTNEIGRNESVLNREFTITAGATTNLGVGDGAIPLLNDDILVDKKNDGGSYDYNKPIGYTSKVTIPSGIGEKTIEGNNCYTTFTLTDTFDEGLRLLENTVAVTVGGKTLKKDVDYQLTPPTAPTETVPSNNKFVITITNPGTTLADYGNQLLTLTYQMEIKQGATPDVDFDNTLSVTTDFDTGTDDGEIVNTGGKRFVKVDGVTDAALKDAAFIIKNEAKDKTLYKVNGKYVWGAAKPTGEAGDTIELVTLTSGTNGEFAIQGLAHGKYYLVETETPGEEYILPDPTEGFEFIVGKNTFNKDGVAVAGEKIKNYTRGTLPATGGMGSMPYFLIGGAGMLGIGYLVRRKKKA